MCEPASIAMAALMVASTTGSMVMQNQQIQHAKGAAEAQQTAANAAAEEAAKVGPAQTSTVTTNDTSSLAAAEAKRKSALRRGILSTIATSGSGVKTGESSSQPAAYAPGSKTTLG